MKLLVIVIIASLITGCISLSAKEVSKIPGGYEPISNLSKVIKDSSGDKLIMLVVKGKDDECPRCAEAMKTGVRAVGSGVMKVFVRAEDFNSMDKKDLPASLQTRAQNRFTIGASVSILVFDPKMEKIIAEISRDELEGNQKLTEEFKKTVQEAKKELK